MSAASAVDVLVIGGGPGGYATALRAVGHGLTVAIVEGDLVGGTCLHRGCIPSKALLHIGHLADQVAVQAELGLVAPGVGLDVAAAGRFRDDVVDQLHHGLEGLLKGRAIDVVRGRGVLLGAGEVEVTTADGVSVRRGRHVVMATGSTPVDLPGFDVDGDRILRSDDALRLARVPTSAVVLGGGAIGVELASLWCSLGVAVTLVEAAPRLLPAEDQSSSTALARAFRRRGIDVRAGVTAVGAAVGPGAVAVTLSDGTALEVDQVLVAVGRRPRTDGTGLAELGLLDDRGFVAVDPWGGTALEGVWAVGDIVPSPALAHAAFAEGFVVADAIAGLRPEPVDHGLIPRVTYSVPEVASVGLTEAEAREVDADVTVTTVSLAGNARAAIEGATGQVKLVCRGDGTVIGAHVVGPSATELIAELGLAISWDALASELGAVVHAHPSLSEALREVALAAAGSPFHAHPS